MDLTQEQQLQWNTLDQELNQWYNDVDPVLAAKMIEFQKGNPFLSEWIDNLFVPGLLGGQEGIQRCLDNVAQESDDMMRSYQVFSPCSFTGHF